MSLPVTPFTLEQIERKLSQAAPPQASGEYPRGAADSYKCAAVLLPIFSHAGEPSVILTRRTQSVNDHKGQVSFPGGACDPQDESVFHTALREAEEEIGLHRRDVKIIGRLPSFETRSIYRIHPVVGIIPWPYCFTPSPDEVERVFSIPLSWLAHPANRRLQDYRGRPVIYYDLFDGELLWGISAHIVVQLVDILAS